ncbi:MAG TPA: hypothetical protein VH481_11270 [Nitrososphaeraceae archaeon]
MHHIVCEVVKVYHPMLPIIAIHSIVISFGLVSHSAYGQVNETSGSSFTFNVAGDLL